MGKATLVLNLMIASLLFGCWKPETGIFSDRSLYPYEVNRNYVLTSDYFIVKREDVDSEFTSNFMLHKAGVSLSGQVLPASLAEWEERKELFLDRIEGGLPQGTVLKFLHVAYVTDWYSNTNVYYSVFESVDNEARYVVSHGPMVSGRRFAPYATIAPLEESNE